MICIGCKYYDAEHTICRNKKARYVGCDECQNANPKPTNGDRIRAMNDEELAKFIYDCVQAELRRVQVRECIATEAAWIEWLKKEMDGG